MSLLVALLQMTFHDAPDVVCIDVAAAESLAFWLGLASTPAIFFAWWYRSRAAADDQHGLWALVALLMGVAQVIASLWRAPLGCMSGHALSIFVGCALPWIVAAGLFRGAVAPTPDVLRADIPRTGDDQGRGDPFA